MRDLINILESLNETKNLFGPIYHRTTANIDKLSQFDIAKANPHSVWGPAIYASLDKNIWNASHLKNGKTLSGFVSGEIIDLTKPLNEKDIQTLSQLIGRNIETVPFLSLEKRFGSVADGLKAAGYSAAIHQGPGSTGKHIAVFDPKNIIDVENND